jgi:hypothetical protein
MADHIITAKCIDKCLDSHNAIQYLPGDVCEFNVTEGRVTRYDGIFSFDRQLFWLKTLGGRWVFEFDRAESSNTVLRLFFCKDCGQPFDKFNAIGTHANEFHKPIKKAIAEAQEIESADEEEQLLALRRAAEDNESKSQQVEA